MKRKNRTDTQNTAYVYNKVKLMSLDTKVNIKICRYLKEVKRNPVTN